MHKNIHLWREALVCCCTGLLLRCPVSAAVLCLLLGRSGVLVLATIKVMANHQKKKQSLIPAKDD